jgi:hypothetical protein
MCAQGMELRVLLWCTLERVLTPHNTAFLLPHRYP